MYKMNDIEKILSVATREHSVCITDILWENKDLSINDIYSALEYSAIFVIIDREIYRDISIPKKDAYTGAPKYNSFILTKLISNNGYYPYENYLNSDTGLYLNEKDFNTVVANYKKKYYYAIEHNRVKNMITPLMDEV